MANQKRQSYYDERSESAGAPLKILGAVALFGLAVLLVYLAFAKPTEATAMGAIRDVMRGIGGSINPLLALTFVWIGVLLTFSARGRRVRTQNVIMNSILFLCIFTAVQLFSARDIIEQHMSITTFANFVSQSYRYGAGGGVLGALFAYPLFQFAEEWGGLIVIILVALLCLLATGRAQKVYRWAAQHAQEDQYRREQRRNERNSERMFDYEAEEPREGAPQMRRNAPQPQPRSRRRKEPERDYIVIADPAPLPKRSPRPSASRKRLYQDDMDPDTEANAAPFETEMEIPKPLRKLRESRAADKKPVREKTVPAPEPPVSDVPDFFTIKEDISEEETFTPQNYETPKKKKRTVVEGTRALGVDGIVPETEPEDFEDDAPFDVPHTSAKSTRKASLDEEKAEEEQYNYPPIDLLAQGEQMRSTQMQKDADRQKADKLIATLESFGIETRLIGIAHGPAVTRFELQPAPGVKVSRITSLADDIALGLAALSVRIEAPIPGKAAVGVEIPNDKVEMVRLRDVLECAEAKRHPSKIAIGLGKDNSGRYIVADIAKMPHVLIAGQTGSGKSVCINSIITSILYRATPEEVRMILIDPKVVELSIYNDIPHLIAPVVTDPKKASSALDWAVAEMSMRYKKFAERDVRDIKGYNKKLEPDEKPMPQIVIVIDELADLMMVAPGEVEDSICRLAQLARAAGMHLVIATQRPSVNVITGIIKANIPTRIAFSVASQVDSRTMIDHGGAEKLLGNGDMLFVPSGINKPLRVQGAWVSDDEVHSIVSYIKARSEVTYDEDVVEKIENSVRSDAEREEVAEEYDPRLPEAIEIVIEAGQASTSMLQRRMRVGYARAGRLIDEMEQRGVISEADGSKPRNVLITREQFNEMFGEEDSDL